jgi:acid ceramidase
MKRSMPSTTSNQIGIEPVLPPVDIDLTVAPESRWAALSTHADGARRLVDSYVRDLGSMGTVGMMVEAYAGAWLPPEYRAELGAIAKMIDRPLADVLLANLYYDAMKSLLMGCTAVAVDSEEGPLHFRNLDWWTHDRLLADLTQVARVSGGEAVGPYSLIGWPGFVGAFSGVAPGRFAITLNAVASDDPFELAPPMTFLIRSVLQSCRTFDEAVETLEKTRVASDSILMVTGTELGEMVVIERTPTRASLRTADNGILVATNDYRSLDGGLVEDAVSELQETACARYDRARLLAGEERPLSLQDGFRILQDPSVKMAITVQHMVMRASTGELDVRIP